LDKDDYPKPQIIRSGLSERQDCRSTSRGADGACFG
jgi:hypothetical protein